MCNTLTAGPFREQGGRAVTESEAKNSEEGATDSLHSRFAAPLVAIPRMRAPVLALADFLLHKEKTVALEHRKW